ncbi:MFS transporter [Uliginosibacterium gangwonense]|uniref:MFS transporter n=1 Tax=Uliginosibacterium gangwonense TaxID=392736 RepID=UPI00036213CD|nr:MFS transporter [Uliginosibacterium gangwonense]
MQLSRNQIQVFSLIAVSILAHVTMGGGRVAASLFALKQQGSETLAGVAYSAYSLLPAILSLHMGRWIDKVGPRRVMRTSQIIMIAGLLLPVVFPHITTVLLAAAVGGFGFGSYMLAANVAVGLMPFAQENERVGMIGWLQMGNSVSAVAGPSIAGIVIDHFGFRAAYTTLALIVVCSLITSFCVDVPGGVGGHKGARRNGDSVVKMVFSDPRLLRIYLLAMVVSMSYDGFSFMTPVLGQERGFSATTIGLILSCFAVGTFAVRALLPWLSRHLPEWRMLSFAFATTTTVFLLLPFAVNGYVHATLGLILGLAAGVGQPSILSLIYRAMPADKAGEGAGLRAMMGNSMGLAGPSIYGAVAGMFGALPVFVTIGSITALSSWQARKGFRLSLKAS